jgi:hypothetical protein
LLLLIEWFDSGRKVILAALLRTGLSQRGGLYLSEMARGVAFPEFRKCHALAMARGYTLRAASQAAFQ